MKKETLTKSEHEIMNLLWHVDRPLTASEIIEQSTDKTWKDSYIHLLINSLLDKGMIRAEGFAKTTKNYARTFVAAVSEEAYAVQQIAGRAGKTVRAGIFFQLFSSLSLPTGRVKSRSKLSRLSE